MEGSNAGGLFTTLHATAAWGIPVAKGTFPAVSPPCSRQGPLAMISCDAMDIWDGVGVWGERGAQKAREKYRTEICSSDEEARQ